MRAAVKGALIVGCILACTGVAAPLKKFTGKTPYRLMGLCMRGVLRIIGVRYEVQGAPARERPLLLVTNHSSYLDIYLLGALLPVRFTPKTEIGGWPLIGAICRLLDCIFIDRRMSRTAANQAALRTALEGGAVVCLFPEGTTGNGIRVLPFSSAYFGLAQEHFAGRPLAVQPAAITYTRVCNLPIDSASRHRIAWYGDMELVPHVRDLLKLGPIRAQVTFLEPVDISQFNGRKELAAYCQRVIAAAAQGE